MRQFCVASVFAAAALAAGGVANAGPITLTLGAGGVAGDRILGEVIPGDKDASGLLPRDEAMIDLLRLMALGQRTGSGLQADPWYYRSTTDFGTLPDAVQAGALAAHKPDMTGTLSTIEITLPATSGFMYLVGAYDGQNGGAQVWYIGDVAAGTTITIPRYGKPVGAPVHLTDGYSATEGSKYGITTWTLFNPTSVPDGGTTAALLGLAMVGLGVVRRLST